MTHDLDIWLMSDELTVIRLALLFLWEDPDEYKPDFRDWKERPRNFDAIFSAITVSILDQSLPATIQNIDRKRTNSRLEPQETIRVQRDGKIQIIPKPNWSTTTVRIADFRQWLRQRGDTDGFFLPVNEIRDAPAVNSDFPPKLAAAVAAWRAVKANQKALRGKSVKAALVAWLEKNAKQQGLIAPNGRINRQAIEDIAKVANWDSKGGAPKTPGQKPTHPF